MWFLLDYDRQRGLIISLRSFSKAQRDEAEQARLDLELQLRRENVEREVVLLEAENEIALRKTHQRYFAAWAALARATAS